MGGLYGVSLGAAFFGESMFSRARDASKVALVHLVALLRQSGYLLLDTQFVTPHLATFGAVELSRPSLFAAAQARDRGRSFRRRLVERQEAFGAASVEHDCWSMIMRRCNQSRACRSLDLNGYGKPAARITRLRAQRRRRRPASRDRPRLRAASARYFVAKAGISPIDVANPPPTATFLRIRWMSFCPDPALSSRYRARSLDQLADLAISSQRVFDLAGAFLEELSPLRRWAAAWTPPLAASFRHKVLR